MYLHLQVGTSVLLFLGRVLIMINIQQVRAELLRSETGVVFSVKAVPRSLLKHKIIRGKRWTYDRYD